MGNVQGGHSRLQAVILAGGLGTRLGRLTRTVPKPMLPVDGRPFLEYEIELLRKNGIGDIVLCVGHLGEAIEDHFGDGREFGVSIRYAYDRKKLLGPAGALKRAEPLLDDSFFVTYGDAYLRADYRMIMSRLRQSGALGLMTVYRNNDRHGRSDIVVKEGRVVLYDKKNRAEGMVWINFGVSALRRRALDAIPPGRPCGEEEFYGKLIALRELISYPVRRRFYEIGTPIALREFERFISGRGTGARRRQLAS
jgi:NDP-sugar pyrophosphorylase family protein